MIAAILSAISSVASVFTALINYFKKTEEAQAESDATSIDKEIETEQTTGRPQ